MRLVQTPAAGTRTGGASSAQCPGPCPPARGAAAGIPARPPARHCHSAGRGRLWPGRRAGKARPGDGFLGLCACVSVCADPLRWAAGPLRRPGLPVRAAGRAPLHTPALPVLSLFHPPACRFRSALLLSFFYVRLPAQVPPHLPAVITGVSDRGSCGSLCSVLLSRSAGPSPAGRESQDWASPRAAISLPAVRSAIAEASPGLRGATLGMSGFFPEIPSSFSSHIGGLC